MAADLLASITAEIDGRLAELRPAAAEYERLLSAADALGMGPAELRASQMHSGGSRNARAKPAAKASQPRRRGAARGSAAGAIMRAASTRPTPGTAAGTSRAVRGAAQHAILAALEHGSHTVGELSVVTAMSGPNIRENLRRMLSSGAVTRAKREGKAAYALATGAGR